MQLCSIVIVFGVSLFLFFIFSSARCVNPCSCALATRTAEDASSLEKVYSVLHCPDQMCHTQNDDMIDITVTALIFSRKANVILEWLPNV